MKLIEPSIVRPDSDLRSSTDCLNNYHPAISFTLEMGGTSLNYHGSPHKICRPTFQIYRKESYSGASIHQSSLHPNVHKHAIITSAIDRILNIPLNQEAQESKTLFIEQIALTNGLNVNVRQMIQRRKLRRILADLNCLPPPHKKERWIRLLGPPFRTNG